MREIILCFREDLYAMRLCEFIRKNYIREFRVIARMEREEFDKVYHTIPKGALLLTDEKEVHKQMKEHEVFYFDFDGRGEGICPYQSAETIIETLLWEGREERPVGQVGTTKRIIFYTPGGSSTQRMAAMNKAQELGVRGPTLYLPVRDTESCFYQEEHPYDLSELCYRMKKEIPVHREHIYAALEKKEDYHILRGFHSPLHIGELGKEISCLADIICRETDYEYLVLDLQILPPDYEALFLPAEEYFAVEDGNTLKNDSVLAGGIRRLKEVLELADDVYKIWRWEEQSSETKAI